MERFRFLAGEVRRLKFSVRNSCDTALTVITSARWELADDKGEIRQEGVCEVDGRNVFALVELPTPGSFRLTVSVEIPPETVKYDLNLTVVGRCHGNS